MILSALLPYYQPPQHHHSNRASISPQPQMKWSIVKMLASLFLQPAGWRVEENSTSIWSSKKPPTKCQSKIHNKMLYKMLENTPTKARRKITQNWKLLIITIFPQKTAYNFCFHFLSQFSISRKVAR